MPLSWSNGASGLWRATRLLRPGGLFFDYADKAGASVCQANVHEVILITDCQGGQPAVGFGGQFVPRVPAVNRLVNRAFRGGVIGNHKADVIVGKADVMDIADTGTNPASPLRPGNARIVREELRAACRTDP